MADRSGLSRSLLKEVLADPPHLPETLALFAVRRLGPRARESAARAPEGEPAEARARLIARGRRNTVSQGAFVGGPFLPLVPVAFCAALLSQARLALDLAALAGRDPAGRERAAELMVIQGVYGDVEPARRALRAQNARLAAQRAGRRSGHPPDTPPGRCLVRRAAALWALTLRMARVLGLLAPPAAGARTRRWRQAGHWALVGLVFAVSIVAPLVWLPYMAWAYDAATARFADRAVRFYFSEPAPLPRRRPRPEPAAVAAAARALLSLLIPVGLVVGVLLAGPALAGSDWPVLVIALVTASVGVGALWLWRRRSGSSRRDADAAEGVTVG